MATIKKIKMFDENGILTPEALLTINDSAFLADMAYKDGKELENLSKPLNKNSPEQPLKSEDGYTIIENPETNTKFEVVRIFSDPNTGPLCASLAQYMLIRQGIMVIK